MSTLSPTLQDRAALYVSGAMDFEEREAFEVILGFHADLRALVAQLEGVAAKVVMSQVSRDVGPRDSLRERILHSVRTLPRPEPEGWVVTDRAGLIEWVNPGFTAMCGFALAELKGRKPGHLLQGPGTDPDAVERIRTSVLTHQYCRETLTNYHKLGTSYRADIRIAPILDDDGQPLWFVARERKLSPAAMTTHA